MRFRPAFAAASVAGIVVLSGCSSSVPTPERSNGGEPTAGVPLLEMAAAPIDRSLPPVSRSHPTPAAAATLRACHIGDQLLLTQVTGMAEIDHASNLPRYVPLSGREPQLADPGPAWVIAVQARMPQPGPDGEVWIDPTCVRTGAETLWYATGPVTASTSGVVLMPEPPPAAPRFRVPPLAP